MTTKMTFVPKFYNLTYVNGSSDDVLDPSKSFWRGMGANLNLNKKSGENTGTLYNNFQDLPDAEKSKQVRFKKVMGILNRLTVDKVELVFEKLEFECTEDSYVGLIAEIIYMKVLVDELYVHQYAALCDKLLSTLPPEKLKCFKSVLISLCQAGITHLLNFTDNVLKFVGEAKGYTFKRRLMTMMRFIGELSCVSLPLFERQWIWMIAETLLLKGEELHLEAAYYILLIGLNQSSDNNWPKRIEVEAEKIANGESAKGKVSPRLKFLFLNLVTLKPSGGSKNNQLRDIKVYVRESLKDIPDEFQKVVVLALNDSEQICKPDIAKLTSQVKLLSESMNGFKCNVHDLNTMVIVSSPDVFSRDWFMTNVNRYSKPEEKFMCIDLEQYSETRFISLLMECRFVRVVELFARSHSELLKNIEESNEGLSTKAWNIIEKSAKNVLDCHYLKITAIVDKESLSMMEKMKYSIEIGPDTLQVHVIHLPLDSLTSNSVSKSTCDDNSKTVRSIDKSSHFSGDGSKKCTTGVATKSDSKSLDSSFVPQVKYSPSSKQDHLKDSPKFKCKFSNDGSKIKFTGKLKSKSLTKMTNHKSFKVNEDGDIKNKELIEVTKIVKNIPAFSSATSITEELQPLIDSKRCHFNASTNFKQSLRCRFKPDRTNWRNRDVEDQKKQLSFVAKRKEHWERKKGLENKAKYLVNASSVSLDKAVDEQSTSALRTEKCKLNAETKNTKIGESSGDTFKNGKSLLEKLCRDAIAARKGPSASVPKVLGESTQSKTQNTSTKKNYLQYMDKFIIRGIFPDCSHLEDDKIFEIISKSNNYLNITDYMVVCRFDQGTFAQLSFVIDDASLQSMLANDFKVNFNADGKPESQLVFSRLTSWSEVMDFCNL